MQLNELSLVVLLISLGSAVAGLLILWLIIYSAVRSALRVHHERVEDDARRLAQVRNVHG